MVYESTYNKNPNYRLQIHFDAGYEAAAIKFVKFLRTRQGSSHRSVRPTDLAQNAYTAAQYIHDNHLLQTTTPPTIPSFSAGNSTPPLSQTFTQSQDNNQHTEVSVEFNQTIITLVEQLTKKEAGLKEGSPEKAFVQKLKSILATAKNSVDVIKLALSLAAEFGLTIHQVKELLS